MKKFSPVVVAFVSFCLVSFHSNPAFAAVIDAVAPPEDAVTVPLEEPYDATGKWNTNTVLANNAQQQREKSKSIVVVLFCVVLFCFLRSK